MQFWRRRRLPTFGFSHETRNDNFGRLRLVKQIFGMDRADIREVGELVIAPSDVIHTMLSVIEKELVDTLSLFICTNHLVMIKLNRHLDRTKRRFTREGLDPKSRKPRMDHLKGRFLTFALGVSAHQRGDLCLSSTVIAIIAANLSAGALVHFILIKLSQARDKSAVLT